MGTFHARKIMLVAVLGWTFIGSPTMASVTITINQSGPDVEAIGNGTIDLTGLQNTINDAELPGISAELGYLKEGDPTKFFTSVWYGFRRPAGNPLLAKLRSPPSEADSTGRIAPADRLTGPATFGMGHYFAATSGTGDPFGIQLLGLRGALMVPSGYVSGAHLSATDTYANQTFSSLGLTPGTYTWTWGHGAHADSLTLQIGTASAVVPEPSTAIVAVFGAVAFVAYGWSRHRRAQRRQAAA
jgi:hypothetical protein